MPTATLARLRPLDPTAAADDGNSRTPRMFTARLRSNLIVRRDPRADAAPPPNTLRRAHTPAPTPAGRNNARLDETTDAAWPSAATAAKRPSHASRGRRAQTDNADWDDLNESPWLRRTPPPMNLEALTNHVLQQLDSRIIASRERMGKV